MVLCTDNISLVTVGAEIPTEASARVGYFIMPHAALGNYSHLADIHSVICYTTRLHTLFQSKVSMMCDLLLLLSILSTLSFPKGHPIAADFFSPVFPSLLRSIFPPVLCL
jgi:hypothetical protein